jgi:hypothetical protein
MYFSRKLKAEWEDKMEDQLIELLELFGYPVLRQGSLSEDESYPDHFFTFWNNDSSNHSHYDNDEYGTDWDFDVNFYSMDPEKTYSVLAQARQKLKEAKWIIPSKGYDVASDEVTHTGRGMEVHYLEV